MITLKVTDQGISSVSESLRSVVGSVNVERVKFEFDESWSGLTRFACFRNKVEFHVLLDDSNECNIPWEVLTNEGTLCVGALGMDGDTVVKPTLWVKYSDVFIGTDPEGAGTTEHTKSALEQMIQIQEETKQIAEDLQEAAESGEFDGKPGYTPIRGKDYWTSEDQQFIVDEATKQVGPLVDEAKTAAGDATAAKESIENMGVSAESVPYDEPAEVEKTIEEDVVNLHFKIPGGKTGNSGVHYGPDKPTDPNTNVWINPEGETDESYYSKTVAAAKRAESSAQSAQQASDDAKAYSESAALSKTSAEEAAQSASTSAQSASTDATTASQAASTAIHAKESAAQSAQQASDAASNAQGFANSAGTSKSTAEQAAREAKSAQSEASTSAQSASDSASAAEQARIDAEAAASVIPKPTKEDAGKYPVVNQDGTGYVFGKAGSGGAGGELLLAEYIHQGNQEIHFTSFDWETGIGECTEPHGLANAVKVMVVPADYPASIPDSNIKYLPYEIAEYQEALYAVPIDDNRIKLTGVDKSTPISVNTEEPYNAEIDMTKLRLEIPIGWEINNFSLGSPGLHVYISGFVMPGVSKYLQILCDETADRYYYLPAVPDFDVYKPKYFVFSVLDIRLSVEQSGTYTNAGLAMYKGRRRDYLLGFGTSITQRHDGYTMIEGTTKPISITGLRNPSGWAYCSNGTVVRVYTLGRRKQ